MTLKLGSTTINKMYIGSSEVTKVYLGSTLVFDNSGGGYTPSDPDAAAFITARETAQGTALDDAVKEAYDVFFQGLKTDSIWSEIDVLYIPIGAENLAGAEVFAKHPDDSGVVFNSFVGGDFSKTTGLKGNGSTKYVDSGYNIQDITSLSSVGLYWNAADMSTATVGNQFVVDIGAKGIAGPQYNIQLFEEYSNNGKVARFWDGATYALSSTNFSDAGIGGQYDSSTMRVFQNGTQRGTDPQAVGTVSNANLYFFAANEVGTDDFYSACRLRVAAIGTSSMTQSLLHSRAATLISTIAAL